VDGPENFGRPLIGRPTQKQNKKDKSGRATHIYGPSLYAHITHRVHNSSSQDFWANFVYFLPNFGEKLQKFGNEKNPDLK